MSRAERIQKLAHAVKDYRGVYDPQTGKWMRAPQPKLRARIAEHLRCLGRDVAAELRKIDGFKQRAEFETWIANI